MQTNRYLRHNTWGFVVWADYSEVSHRDMAERLGWPLTDLHSAGFVRYVQGMPVCTGYSGSLAISSMPGDTRALLVQLGVVPAGTLQADMPAASPTPQAAR